jgi:D-alanyl-D-alanine carboxypeptidase (penicillin-binding protein 5/6)
MKKIIRSVLTILLAASLMLGTASPCLAVDEDPPVIDARAAVMMDAASGNVLYSLNADTPLYVAGLTVMMTALLAAEAVERGDIAYGDMVTASGASHNDITSDASIQNIVPGEQMSLKDLLCCALVGGASEACNIIGEYVSGSTSRFISDMNRRALELGCEGTSFVNTHGLPNENHFSTAYDMALIAAAFVQHEELIELANTITAEIPATNVSGARKLTNGNYILRQDYTRYYYSYACGIKSTYTDDAGYCLASSMKTDGSYVVSIVLGCKVMEADNGFYDIQSFIQTRRLFQWFNSCYSLRDVVSTIEPVAEVPVRLAEGTDTVVCCASEGLKLFLPNDLDISKEYTRHIRIFSQQEGAEELTAPISRGQVLGELTVRAEDGSVYGPFPLIANTDVAVSRVELMRQRLDDLVHGKTFRIIFITAIVIIALYIVYVISYRVRRSKERRARRRESRESASSRR